MMKEILKKLLLFFHVSHTTRIEPGETELDYVPKNEIFNKKRNSKQFPKIKIEESFVKTRTKRKPKTVADWEDKFDLGGNE